MAMSHTAVANTPIKQTGLPKQFGVAQLVTQHPTNGENNEPAYCSAPNAANASTEPDCTSTNQPSISISISNAHEAAKSPPHCRRKLLIRNGAKVRLLTLVFDPLRHGN